MGTNLTDIFIDNIWDFLSNPLPSSVISQAENCLIDSVGEAIAGSQMVADIGNNYLDSFISEPAISTVIGFHRKSGVQSAALINSISIHSTEMDDGQRVGAIHLGAAVIPAIISVSEHEKIYDARILKGIIFGYEVAIRLASSLQPYHKKRGYHTSGTCGTIGAAIGVAVMLGLSKSQIKDTLALAATSAAGLLEVQENSSRQKPYNLGRASMDGIAAAYMAKAGMNGPDDVLGGQRGLFAVLGNEVKTSYITDFDFNRYAIESIYLKPYAACRHCHPAIDCTLALKSKNHLKSEDIQSIEVGTYNAAISGHDHTEIKGISSAMLSIPFSVALSMHKGQADLKSFTELYNNPEILELTDKISIKENSELSGLAPSKRGAKVIIKSTSGNIYVEKTSNPKGEPENPMSPEELFLKFISLAEYGGIDHKMAADIICKIKKIKNN